jgi:hypothetical protein
MDEWDACVASSLFSPFSFSPSPHSHLFLLPHSPLHPPPCSESTRHQLWMLFDANKQMVGTGDSFDNSATVTKGDYTLRLQVRYDDASVLEGLQDMPVFFETSLTKAISLSIYSSMGNAVRTRMGCVCVCEEMEIYEHFGVACSLCPPLIQLSSCVQLNQIMGGSKFSSNKTARKGEKVSRCNPLS